MQSAAACGARIRAAYSSSWSRGLAINRGGGGGGGSQLSPSYSCPGDFTTPEQLTRTARKKLSLGTSRKSDRSIVREGFLTRHIGISPSVMLALDFYDDGDGSQHLVILNLSSSFVLIVEECHNSGAYATVSRWLRGALLIIIVK